MWRDLFLQLRRVRTQRQGDLIIYQADGDEHARAHHEPQANHWPTLKKDVQDCVLSCRCRMRKRPWRKQFHMLPGRFLRRGKH